MRAIISVANREGLKELARALQSQNATIFSTTGTAGALKAKGIEVEPVSALTGFPEILDGRVKTLHPAIFAGILARREIEAHLHDLQEHDIAPIDMVAVNLYPFADTIARPDATFSEALEQIDIGGVSLIRAAAKNFQDVIVLVRPQDYAPVMQELQEKGRVSFDTRRRLAPVDDVIAVDQGNRHCRAGLGHRHGLGRHRRLVAIAIGHLRRHRRGAIGECDRIG